MARRRDVRLAWLFAALLAVVVGVRVVVVASASTTGPTRLAVTLVVLVVFVGIPAAYGIRGVLRGDGADRHDGGG